MSFRRLHTEVTMHDKGDANVEVIEAAQRNEVALAVLAFTTPGGEYVRQIVISGDDARMIEILAWLVSIGPDLISDYARRLQKVEADTPLAPIPGSGGGTVQ